MKNNGFKNTYKQHSHDSAVLLALLELHEVVGLEELDEEEVEVVAATVVCGFQTGKGMHVEGLS